MSRLFTLQDDKGGFELVGSAIKITGGLADIYDLKKVLTSNVFFFILLWEHSQKRNDKSKAEHCLCNMCCEFMVLSSCAMLCI